MVDSRDDATLANRSPQRSMYFADGSVDPDAQVNRTLNDVWNGPFSDKVYLLAKKGTGTKIGPVGLKHVEGDACCNSAILFYLDDSQDELPATDWPKVIAWKAHKLFLDEVRRQKRRSIAQNEAKKDLMDDRNAEHADPEILAEIEDGAAMVTRIVCGYHSDQCEAVLVGVDLLDLYAAWLKYYRDGRHRPFDKLRKAVADRCATVGCDPSFAANHWPEARAEVYVECADSRASEAIVEPLKYFVAARRLIGESRRDPKFYVAFWLREWKLPRGEALEHAGLADNDANKRALNRFSEDVRDAARAITITPDALRDFLPRPAGP